MGTLYERISELCKVKGVTPSRMCLDLGMSKSTVSDLKSGRKSGLSAANASKISNYLGVTVGYLLGEETEKAPAESGKRSVSDAELKFALWGDCEDVSDDDLADVLRYAAFVRERKKDKK